jgi:hypothetical protein
MNRNDFFKSIGLGVIGLMIPKFIQSTTTKPGKKITLLHCFVAGYRYYEGENIESQMQEGMDLQLIREPKNDYDSSAISVHYKTTKLGYIPQYENLVLANMMDQQAKISAVVGFVDTEAPPWERVEIEVMMSD